jgi:hypothetical protein
MVVIGEADLRLALKAYASYYNWARTDPFLSKDAAFLTQPSGRQHRGNSHPWRTPSSICSRMEFSAKTAKIPDSKSVGGFFTMWAVKTLKEWHDFYTLVGTAGATLLGLLFIAVSLGAGYLTQERQSATRTFMSPVVVHFTSVFFLSAVALFPWHQAKFLAVLVGATALIGAIISTYITIQVVRTDLTNYMQDYLAYGLLPGVAYLVLLDAAVSIYLEKDFGLDALAGALLLLTIANIRNAWDLTLTMVRRPRRND